MQKLGQPIEGCDVVVKARISEEEFISLFETYGGEETAVRLGVTSRSVHRRRRRLEIKYKRPVSPPDGNASNPYMQITQYPGWSYREVNNGIVIMGSDAHIWPGKPSPAMRAFIHMIKELQPVGVILNGDGLDFPRISRHPPIGWKYTPTVVEELEAAQTQLAMIEDAAGKAWKDWPLGNHDARFETNLASKAPEFAKVRGTSLIDHFPLWEPSWAVNINDDLIVKHRFKGGIHAAHNNTLWAGKSTATGHLHRCQVTPFTDYRGLRYGIETGLLAEVRGRTFLDYTEANPLNWQEGFIVATFYRGGLLHPEPVLVVDDKHIQFRGKLIKI